MKTPEFELKLKEIVLDREDLQFAVTDNAKENKVLSFVEFKRTTILGLKKETALFGTQE
jgi:hypothetical protein